LADTRLAQKISQVTGVGLVSISGGQKPAARVLKPHRRTVVIGHDQAIVRAREQLVVGAIV